MVKGGDALGAGGGGIMVKGCDALGAGGGLWPNAPDVNATRPAVKRIFFINRDINRNINRD